LNAAPAAPAAAAVQADVKKNTTNLVKADKGTPQDGTIKKDEVITAENKLKASTEAIPPT